MILDRKQSPTLFSVLNHWCERDPNKVALVDLFANVQISYGDLGRKILEFSRCLKAQGVDHESRVAVYFSEHATECLALFYAINQLGALWIPINPKSTKEEFSQLMTLSHASHLVSDTLPPLWSEMLSKGIVFVGMPLETCPEDLEPEPNSCPDPGSTVGLLYTSGTTGLPKGVIHSHRSMIGWMTAFVHSHRWQADDRILNPYPLYHMGGIGFSLAGLSIGATMYLSGPFDPSGILEALSRHRITSMIAVPTMWTALMAHLPQPFSASEVMPGLKKISATSAPLLRPIEDNLRKLWPLADLYVIYSATEAFFTTRRPEDRPRHPRSVGQSAYGMDISIRDDHGQIVPSGQPGLVYTRGISLCEGYSKESQVPDGTFMAEGWFTCHDVGYLDEDGFLYLLDRSRDLIKTGGETVSSLEVEEVILRHAKVQEAAVIGVPDTHWGQRVHAVVKLIPGESLATEELLAFLRRHLSGFKMPKTVQWVDELPKSSVGKVLKRTLKERAPANL